MKLNCLLIDNDEEFQDHIAEIVDDLSLKSDYDPVLVGTTADAEEADEILKKNDIGLVIYNAGIQDEAILDFIQNLPTPSLLIVVSEETQHAKEAFEWGAIDFLEKPFDQQRFEKALTRALEETKYRDDEILLTYEEKVLEKVICYMYTRNIKELDPVLSKEHSIGYYYPIGSDSFGFSEQHKVMHALNMGVDRGLFTREFVETIHSCYNCFNSFLLYREACPECGSSNLESEDLIHHFPCAYVGPESDFEDEGDSDELICPKCNKELKHIGVDYDKPSRIYSCRNCDNTFQNVIIKAKCTNCTTDIKVENLKRNTIFRYQITKGGEHAAEKGL